MSKAAYAAFYPVTYEILQIETTPPKFSNIEAEKLARKMAPVNSSMDDLLDKAGDPENKEKAFFLIYQHKWLFP